MRFFYVADLCQMAKTYYANEPEQSVASTTSVSEPSSGWIGTLLPAYAGAHEEEPCLVLPAEAEVEPEEWTDSDRTPRARPGGQM